MKASNPRFIGIDILVAALLAAAALQISDSGLIVRTELHPVTSPEMAAQGMDVAGGQHIDLSRLMVLSIIGMIGLMMVLLPNRYRRPVAI